jgi:organic radical activating enzyme
MSGCNLACPWCDTDHSAQTKMTEIEIVERAAELIKNIFDQRKVMFVITGGEPTLFDLFTLFTLLQIRFPLHTVAVETNGHNLSNIPFGAWVTISPKMLIQNCEPFFQNERWYGHELKVVFEPGIERSILESLPERLKYRFNYFYIQPLSQNFEPAVTFVKENPQWKLSVQIHRLINIT